MIRTCFFASFALYVLGTGTARAQFITQSTVIDNVMGGCVVVGYGSAEDLQNRVSGTSPTVTIVGGGVLCGQQCGLTACNGSSVTMLGGLFCDSGGIAAFDSSTVLMSGGHAGAGAGVNNPVVLTGRVEVLAGQVTGDVMADNGGSILVTADLDEDADVDHDDFGLFQRCHSGPVGRLHRRARGDGCGCRRGAERARGTLASRRRLLRTTAAVACFPSRHSSDVKGQS